MNNLEDNLNELKIRELYVNIINNSKLNTEDVLIEIEKIIEEQVTNNTNKRRKMLIQAAGFPKMMTYEQFDFEYNTSIDKIRIDNLITLEFLEQNKNIIFIGNSGVGKTHLSVSLGIKAAEKRKSTYFIKCNALLQKLQLAKEENRLEQRLRHYAKYKILIIDEIGFLPIDKEHADMLFQLIDLRYEAKSTIVTSNIGFEQWNTIFKDPMITSAIIDRLLHHSEVFKVTGQSYRTKNFEYIESEEKSQK